MHLGVHIFSFPSFLFVVLRSTDSNTLLILDIARCLFFLLLLLQALVLSLCRPKHQCLCQCSICLSFCSTRKRISLSSSTRASMRVLACIIFEPNSFVRNPSVMHIYIFFVYTSLLIDLLQFSKYQFIPGGSVQHHVCIWRSRCLPELQEAALAVSVSFAIQSSLRPLSFHQQSLYNRDRLQDLWNWCPTETYRLEGELSIDTEVAEVLDFGAESVWFV